MATTTPNYGWTVPTSTDLVKDGATAIETLGDAIDASMNTALGTKKAGMVLLNTTSFNAVTSQSINDVFNATYRAYRIVFNLTAGLADADLTLRFRVAGSDASGSDYNYGVQGWNINGAAAGGFGSASDTKFFFGQTDLGTNAAVVSNIVDVVNPFNTVATTMLGQIFGPNTAGTFFSYTIGGRHSLTTSYTGFSIISSQANSLTGSVSVYGYNI
jgi:hypothetical protein